MDGPRCCPKESPPPLTPSPRYSGERAGERGPVFDGDLECQERRTRRPLSPTLSPGYRGEGVARSRPRLPYRNRIPRRPRRALEPQRREHEGELVRLVRRQFLQVQVLQDVDAVADDEPLVGL